MLVYYWSMIMLLYYMIMLTNISNNIHQYFTDFAYHPMDIGLLGLSPLNPMVNDHYPY